MVSAPVPQSPAELNFPEKFTAFRQQQTVAAMRIAHAFEQTDDVILQAPPGVGKTLLSMLLTRMLTRPRRFVMPAQGPSYNEHGAAVATITKLLQQQYLDDFPEHVLTAKGRDNFICLVDETQTAAQAPCNHGWDCPAVDDCPYIGQRNQADDADVAVLNTAFLLYEQAYTTKFQNYDLTIYDEAHQLEQSILGYAGKWVSRRLFERLGLEMPAGTELFPDGAWSQFWADHAIEQRLALAHERKKMKAQMKLGGGVNLDPLQANRLRDLSQICDIARAFARAETDPEHWLLSPAGDGNLQLRSIWGYPWASQVIHPKASRKRLYMSGTILSPEYLAFTLGIENYRYIEIPSSFPAVQRPFYYVPTVKMSARVTDDELDHLVAVMDAIIRQRHLGQKGIIHTVSYRLRDEIMMRSQWKALMVTHGAADRIAVLERFKQLPDGYILVSPSMTTGVDLPEDQCRWQFLPKMPFPYLGDELVRLRKEDDRLIDWHNKQVKVGDLSYAWATATAIVQAYGRAMRSESDWGHTYLFDSNFWGFQTEQRWGPLFPDYFREAIRYCKPSDLGVDA